jgi:hypothetical protein
MDADQIEVVNRGEALLLRARVMAYRIKERVCGVMARHGLPVPQRPAIPSKQEARWREGAARTLLS